MATSGIREEEIYRSGILEWLAEQSRLLSKANVLIIPASINRKSGWS
ncbi:MAG: hypothetical protein ACE5DY_06945 [Mariprofundaceae bacterium]